MLIPVEGLSAFLGSRGPGDLTVALLSQVVQRFLVSPAIAAIALEQAGYIAESTKADWIGITTPRLAWRFGWIDQYRALQAESNRRRAPQRLLARAINGYLEDVISAQTLATLRGVDVATVQAELRDAGIESLSREVIWSDAADLEEVEVDLRDLDDLPGNSPAASAE